MRAPLLLPLAAWGAAAAAQDKPVAPAMTVSDADIAAAVAAMEKDMKPGQTFLWRPLLRAGSAIAAIEIWKAPGKPAVHLNDAEYARVIGGSGTLVSGGSLADPQENGPGQLEGSRIEGGTVRPLEPGDTFLVPAGLPHSFGIRGGELILLGIKVPQTER